MSGEQQTQAESDSGLLQRARSGDPAALEALLARNSEHLRRNVNRRLGRVLRGKLNPSDILQSTYLQVLGSIGEFQGNSERDFANWIVRILENTIRTRARYFSTRKRSAGNERVENLETVDPPAEEATPSQHVAVSEELQRIAQAMTRLPPDYVRVLTLHMDGERTHRETARLLGRSEGASRVLLARARAALLVELRRSKVRRK